MNKTENCHYGIVVRRVSDLIPTKGQRSFYGKAKLVETDNELFLQSYDTLVCYRNEKGEFKRLWDGYSPTTMRHVDSFLDYCGMQGGGKKWWDALSGKEKENGQNCFVAVNGR